MYSTLFLYCGWNFPHIMLYIDVITWCHAKNPSSLCLETTQTSNVSINDAYAYQTWIITHIFVCVHRYISTEHRVLCFYLWVADKFTDFTPIDH